MLEGYCYVHNVIFRPSLYWEEKLKKKNKQINNKITQHHPKNPLTASLLSNSCDSEILKKMRYFYSMIKLLFWLSIYHVFLNVWNFIYMKYIHVKSYKYITYIFQSIPYPPSLPKLFCHFFIIFLCILCFTNLSLFIILFFILFPTNSVLTENSA